MHHFGQFGNFLLFQKENLNHDTYSWLKTSVAELSFNLNDLDSRGDLDNFLVVVASDHGTKYDPRSPPFVAARLPREIKNIAGGALRRNFEVGSFRDFFT